MRTRRIVTGILFFCFACTRFAAGEVKKASPVESPGLYDTSALNLKKLSPGDEKSVFGDKRLRYREADEDELNVIEIFFRWLRNKLFGKVSDSSVNTSWWIIIWSVVAIAAFMLVRLLLRSELTGLAKGSGAATAFNFAEVTEDLSALNFDRKIREALDAGDFRLATRWLYLKTLFLLDRNRHIVFSPYKTNIDYRNELSNTAMKGTFSALSRIYEYVWYGQFVIDHDRYKENAERFFEFEKQLNV